MICAVCGEKAIGDDSGLLIIDHSDGNVTKIPFCRKHQAEVQVMANKFVSGAS